MTLPSDQSLQALLQRLVRPAAGEAGRPFVLGETGTVDLYTLRAAVLTAMKQNLGEAEPLLVATQDRSRIAAAVLAALAGGNELILPHAISAAVLRDLRDNHRVRFVFAEDTISLPQGMAELPLGAPPLPGATGEFRARGPEESIVGLFTGGSTGQARMWAKTARNLVGEAAFLARRFRIGPEDVILAAVTPQHIYGLLFSVLLPLVSGASVAPETPRFQGEIEKSLVEYRATVLAAAPAHYRALRGKEIPGHCLKLAVSSGGLLPEEDSLGFSSRTGVWVTEVYGSTETGGVATRARAQGEQTWTPFACVQWRTRQEQLCVQSPFLSPGLPLDGEGFFVTGDRVQVERDGTFTLLGRVDGVVKVAGKRVNLDGVEARIKALPHVRDAYVLALSSDTMREAEIVCLVAPDDEVFDDEDFRESLRSVLEPSALPRRVRWVPEIPLTPAGKRDRERAERFFSELPPKE